MNPAEYILPPEQVKARFPVEVMAAEPEALQAIIKACAEQLGTSISDVELSIANTGVSDFRDRTVTLTVRTAPKPTVFVEAMRSSC